jgi:hypothetical protein
MLEDFDDLGSRCFVIESVFADKVPVEKEMFEGKKFLSTMAFMAARKAADTVYEKLRKTGRECKTMRINMRENKANSVIHSYHATFT